MKTILVTAIVLMSVFFVGCGGGDNTTAIESDSANTTKIVTQEDARKAVSLVESMHLDVLASGISQSLSTQLGLKAAPNRITYPVPYSKQRECSVSGTVNTSGKKSNVFTYHATNVFDDCKHIDNIVVNGTQSVDATLENNKLVASLSDNNIEVSRGEVTMNLTAPIKLYANRDFSFVEIILQESGQLFKSGNAFQEIFVDFNVTIDTKNTNMYLNGFTQVYGCGDEGYDIQTIVPVTIGSNGGFASGELNINGALFEFNNNNTVTVTLTNGDIYTMVQGMDVICELNPDELLFIRDDAKKVVIDTNTQLMWQDDSEAQTVRKPWLTQANYDAQDWFNTAGDTAATYCSELTLGGHEDWRLPSQVELASLLEDNPMLSPTISPVFKNIVPNYYWSSDSDPEGSGLVVDFQNAALEDDIKQSSHAVRCVRDGVLTRQQPLNPPTCKGYILESGNDTNGDGILDDDEVISELPYYENGTPITRKELERKIAAHDDVTSVNTCKITDMSKLFLDNTTFNQDISSWNVAAVINMSLMFYSAEAFNQPLNDWNVSNVTNMSLMFSASSAQQMLVFNQPLNNWDVSNVTNMSGMFVGTKVFNQPLNNWDVSNVTNMGEMFMSAKAFNQPLDHWDTSNITNMSLMFNGAFTFNQPLNNWDVSNVRDMTVMFNGAFAFNQPLNNWDTSNVTNMSWMFAGAFNQPLNNWDVSNVKSMMEMFDGSSLSTANYDALLEGWSSQTLQHNVMFSVGWTKYSLTSQAARDILTGTYNWTIEDGGGL